ncbi:HAMP domain-containing histidine kinase [Peptacetobacter hominis]|uniref:histidine kinase n=1 Tax=Peptacetobacter hominis TaxID=2743610 RepID=A0A544QW92_9FIRM|nr:HAMP domain-containing sensor histidine kinase [Peptacetobacter hominis]TQQ84951.1 HAMP domain-containing histidine kinase [Peptacetobacter hominis]
MYEFGKFISKHLLMYILILIFIVVMNISVFFISYNNIVYGINKENPIKILDMISDNLSYKNEKFELTHNTTKILEKNGTWAVLLDDEGYVVWSFNIPKEIATKYTIQDAVNFSRGYLSDYPVFTQKYKEKILVLGYPKGSYFKILSNYLPMSIIKRAPYTIAIMLVLDIIILFIVYYLSKYRVMRKIAPILDGLSSLSNGQNVTLNVKGELEKIGEGINKTSEQLKKQDNARANWISGVSHDIRTPLSMIMGYADQISKASDIGDDTKRQAEIIKFQSIKIKNLVQDLNLVSQLNYNIQPIKKSSIYLCKIIRQIVSEYMNNDIEEIYEFELSLTEESEVVSIEADERLIYRAIQNIISNSITHNENGCKISISLDIKENIFILTISDNGKGISDEEIKILHETPHYIQSTDDRLDLRHGLGIFIVKEIVMLHNGKIEMSSKLNKGFSTKIYLPI